MWMCAGFTMLESGSVRTKNASMICMKNIGLYSIAGLAFFFIGYNLMYVDVTHVIGSFQFLRGPSLDEIALVSGQEGVAASVIQSGRSTMSDWFFQMVFVATAASIVSGALAERVKMWSFFLFTLFLTALIYPIVGAWTWGGGWLNELGFPGLRRFDHRTRGRRLGGARGGAGRRSEAGKIPAANGSARPTPPSNVLIVTLGVFILWFGWFGFNAGSQLALGSAADAVTMSHVLVNTNLAAAAGSLGGPRLFAAHPWAHGPVRRTERRYRRAGLYYRRPGLRRPLLGDRHRAGRRRMCVLPGSSSWRKLRWTMLSGRYPPTFSAESGAP